MDTKIASLRANQGILTKREFDRQFQLKNRGLHTASVLVWPGILALIKTTVGRTECLFPVGFTAVCGVRLHSCLCTQEHFPVLSFPLVPFLSLFPPPLLQSLSLTKVHLDFSCADPNLISHSLLLKSKKLFLINVKFN